MGLLAAFMTQTFAKVFVESHTGFGTVGEFHLRARFDSLTRSVVVVGPSIDFSLTIPLAINGADGRGISSSFLDCNVFRLDNGFGSCNHTSSVASHAYATFVLTIERYRGTSIILGLHVILHPHISTISKWR